MVLSSWQAIGFPFETVEDEGKKTRAATVFEVQFNGNESGNGLIDQVLASERRLLQPDLYIRSLVGCLKAVVLQPPNKCGLQQVISIHFDRNQLIMVRLG